jgi:hypothetical protein
MNLVMHRKENRQQPFTQKTVEIPSNANHSHNPLKNKNKISWSLFDQLNKNVAFSVAGAT